MKYGWKSALLADIIAIWLFAYTYQTWYQLFVLGPLRLAALLTSIWLAGVFYGEGKFHEMLVFLREIMEPSEEEPS